MRINPQNAKAYKFYFLCACILTLIVLLSGCWGSTPKPVVQLATALDSGLNPVEEQFQIPITHEDIAPPAGWDDSRNTAQIIVPPSTEPTTIYVRPKKLTLKQKLIPSRSEDTIEVVSSDKRTTTKQETVTPWWWWLMGGTTLIGVAGLASKLIWGFVPFSEAFGFIIRLFRKK